MAKKRGRPSQSTTLHNFFTSGPSLAPAEKAIVQSPASRGKGKQRVTSLPAEVVIIDSDDDEDKYAKRAKRRVDSSSSDIEIVEDIHVALKRPSLEGKADRKACNSLKSRSRASSDGDRVQRGGSHHSPSFILEDGDVLSFGQPSSLLRSSSPPLPAKSSETDSLFGLPTSLLCPDGATEPISFGKPTSILGHSHQPTSSRTRESVTAVTLGTDTVCQISASTADFAGPSSIVLPISIPETVVGADEEWGTGDDEMAFDVPEQGEDESMEVVDIPSSPSDEHAYVPQEKENIIACPMCGKQLNGAPATEVQDHVNECLDSVPVCSSSSTPGPRPPRPFSPHNHAPAPSTSAFSVLMSSHRENEEWKEAQATEDRKLNPTKTNGGRRKAPFYKILQGMPIAVDAFNYGTIPSVEAYFLTHAHSDHYTNLAANWKSGPIYCSQGTANLIIHMLSVDAKWVRPLPMDIPTLVPSTGGVHVTLIEANHCPGSCLFFFEGPQTVNAGDSAFKSSFVDSPRVFRYLHCGDFRASPQHVLHPAVKGKKIDIVYLDTTYLDPKYSFPPQPQVISACAELAKRLVLGRSLTAATESPVGVLSAKGKKGWFTIQEKASEKIGPKGAKEKGRALVIVGTYSIGKERIVKAIAHALQTKVYCDARKAAILRCQADPELHALLTSDPRAAGVHLLPLGMITSDKLKEYLERFKGVFNTAIGFRPTGWTYRQAPGADPAPPLPALIARAQQHTYTHAQLQPTRASTPTLQLYGVPYSEHSSFFELTCFALSLEWGRIIATVNVGTEGSRARMGKWVEKWAAERKRRTISGEEEVLKFRQADYW